MSKLTSSRQPVALPTSSKLLGLGPRPVDLIEHSAWNEALERLTTLVDTGPALIALLGAPGTGKTALLRRVAALLRERGRTVHVLWRGDSSVDVRPAEILLMDEADRISDTRLQEYCGRRDVAVVFAALPTSRKRFESYPGMSLIRLPRLKPVEAREFVAARLAQLGLPRESLTKGAWAQLIAHCGGAPRLLLGVLGHALFIAGEEHAACVTGAQVDEAIEARGGNPKAIAVEPLPAELNFAEERLPAIVPEPEVASTQSRLELTRSGRYADRLIVGLYLGTVAAMYAVPVAAWLTWSTYRHGHNVAAPGIDSPAIVVAQTSPAMPVGAAHVGGHAATTRHPMAPAADAGSSGHDTAVVENPAPPAASAPVVVARGPDSNALAVRAGSAGHDTAGAENPAPPAASAPVVAAKGPDSDALADQARSAGHDTAGAENPAPPASSAPVVIAMGPDSDAPAVQAGSAGQGAPGVTGELGGAEAGKIAPENEASAMTTGAMEKLPSGEPIPSGPAEHRRVAPSLQLGPVAAEQSPSAPDRGPTSIGGSGIGQRSASAGNTVSSDLSTKFAGRTRHTAAPAPERHRAQTQFAELSHRFGQASSQGTGVQVQVARNSYHEVPTVDVRQAPSPGPFPRTAFMQHPVIVHAPSPVQQLLSARKALVESNSSAARGLLEAAQTAIVFEAGAAPRGNGIAVGQIVNALSLLNSGSTARALPHLDQAITALQSTS